MKIKDYLITKYYNSKTRIKDKEFFSIAIKKLEKHLKKENNSLIDIGGASGDFLNIIASRFPNLNFTLPNSDPYSELIKKIIIKHVNKKPDSRYFSQSVGNFIYLNLLKNCELVIGNSSSGIIEAPSFKIPTINIGERQEGRLKAKSTIDCDTNKQQIIKSIETAIEKKFKTICARVVNPYGDGMSSKRIVKILKDLKYPLQIKKEFYNIKVP